LLQGIHDETTERDVPVDRRVSGPPVQNGRNSQMQNAHFSHQLIPED
jgi:hypothetical protein